MILKRLKEILKPSAWKLSLTALLFLITSFLPNAFLSQSRNLFGFPLTFYAYRPGSFPTGGAFAPLAPEAQVLLLPLIFDLLFWYLVSSIIFEELIPRINEKMK